MPSRTIHTCSKCGEQYDRSNLPPWAPDYCPLHMPKDWDKGGKYLHKASYTSKPDPNTRVWW